MIKNYIFHGMTEKFCRYLRPWNCQNQYCPFTSRWRVSRYVLWVKCNFWKQNWISWWRISPLLALPLPGVGRGQIFWKSFENLLKGAIEKIERWAALQLPEGGNFTFLWHSLQGGPFFTFDYRESILKNVSLKIGSKQLFEIRPFSSLFLIKFKVYGFV